MPLDHTEIAALVTTKLLLNYRYIYDRAHVSLQILYKHIRSYKSYINLLDPTMNSLIYSYLRGTVQMPMISAAPDRWSHRRASRTAASLEGSLPTASSGPAALAAPRLG